VFGWVDSGACFSGVGRCFLVVAAGFMDCGVAKTLVNSGPHRSLGFLVPLESTEICRFLGF